MVTTEAHADESTIIWPILLGLSVLVCNPLLIVLSLVGLCWKTASRQKPHSTEKFERTHKYDEYLDHHI